MRARLPTALAAAFALIALAAPPAAPAAETYGPALSKVVKDFAATRGNLDPCAYTVSTLKQARREIPPKDELPEDLRKLEAPIRKAIADALAAHERGDCSSSKRKKKRANPAPAPIPANPGPAAPAPAAPSTDGGGVDTDALGRALGGSGTAKAEAAPAATTPAPAAAPPVTPVVRAARPVVVGSRDGDSLALVLALGAIGGLALAALLAFAVGRRLAVTGRAPAARHAASEATFRAGAVWADFVDWVRLGR